MKIIKTLFYCLTFTPLLHPEQAPRMNPKHWCEKFSQLETLPDGSEQQLEVVKYLQSKTHELGIALKETKEIKDIQGFLNTEPVSALNNPETQLSNLMPETLTENSAYALYDDLLECFLCAMHSTAKPLRQR